MRASAPTTSQVCALLIVFVAGCAGLQSPAEPEVQSRRRAVLEERNRLSVAAEDWPEPATSQASLQEEPVSIGTPPPTAELALEPNQPSPTPSPSQGEATQPGEEQELQGAAVASQTGFAMEESVASLIRADMPPQVAAALRCVEQGRTFLQKGQLQAAREWFERALTLDGNNPYAYFFLAQLARRSGREDQADAFLERAATLASRAPNTWRSRILSLRGEVLEAVGRFPEARQAYRDAAALDPNNAGARAGLARLSTPN